MHLVATLLSKPTLWLYVKSYTVKQNINLYELDHFMTSTWKQNII